MTALLVGAAAVVGALVRFGLDTYLARKSPPGRPTFPWSTLVVNVAGSFLIGLAFGLLMRGALAGDAYPVAAAGLAGGLTTFSSWSVATLQLWLERRPRAAAVNLAANVLLGVLAAAAGRLLAG